VSVPDRQQKQTAQSGEAPPRRPGSTTQSDKRGTARTTTAFSGTGRAAKNFASPWSAQGKPNLESGTTPVLPGIKGTRHGAHTGGPRPRQGTGHGAGHRSFQGRQKARCHGTAVFGARRGGAPPRHGVGRRRGRRHHIPMGDVQHGQIRGIAHAHHPRRFPTRQRTRGGGFWPLGRHGRRHQAVPSGEGGREGAKDGRGCTGRVLRPPGEGH